MVRVRAPVSFPMGTTYPAQGNFPTEKAHRRQIQRTEALWVVPVGGYTRRMALSGVDSEAVVVALLAFRSRWGAAMRPTEPQDFMVRGGGPRLAHGIE
jgi:hypothetical protein